MHRPPPKCSSYCLPRENRDFTGGSVSIFTILFVILLVAWVLGWGVFHVASAMIHILLVVALISLVLHFIRGPRAV